MAGGGDARIFPSMGKCCYQKIRSRPPGFANLFESPPPAIALPRLASQGTALYPRVWKWWAAGCLQGVGGGSRDRRLARLSSRLWGTVTDDRLGRTRVLGTATDDRLGELAFWGDRDRRSAWANSRFGRLPQTIGLAKVASWGDGDVACARGEVAGFVVAGLGGW